jgi:septal ring factor EnvC (AmiA/AmiB activator)
VADDTKLSRRALVALCVAGLVLAASIAWGVSGLRARDGAERDVAKMQAALTSIQREDARLAARLARAQATLEWLRAQSGTFSDAEKVSQLDRQEVGFMQRALDAGLAGDVGVYNDSVNARNRLNASHDATVEALRNTVDALKAQLAQV